MDPSQKLAPSPVKPRASCCSVKSSKRVGALLAFHLLNVLVSVGGGVAVALLLASMVLMPAWMAAMAIVVFVVFLLHLAQQIPHKCGVFFGYGVLMVLYVASFSLDWYLAYGPYMLFGVGAVGVMLFYLSTVAVKFLVKADVHVANLIKRTDSTQEHQELVPEECMERFVVSKATDISILLPHVLMTRRVWVAALYFAAVNVAMGVLSAAVLVCTVVLPVLVVVSRGDAPFVGSQATFHDNRVVYILSSLSIWLAGAIGLPVVAALSAKLTTRVWGMGVRKNGHPD